jgi:hypothetical protein
MGLKAVTSQPLVKHVQVQLRQVVGKEEMEVLQFDCQVLQNNAQGHPYHLEELLVSVPSMQHP